MDNGITACGRYLQNKHIKYLQEWLEACIEWIAEENNGLPPINELSKLVFDQWLMADLNEISVPSFPQALASRKGHSTLQGKFCAQINLIIDIGHSAYSQLQKLKGQEIEEITEDDDNNIKEFFSKGSDSKDSKQKNGKWRETSSRMVFMELHDGAQSVDAIEYQPIPHLKIEEVSPGGKVLLTGPITCFDGTLLLKAVNIQLLGGNAEKLLDSKTQQRVLCNILEIRDDQNKFDPTSNQQTITTRQSHLNNDERVQRNHTVEIKQEESKNNLFTNQSATSVVSTNNDDLLNDLFDDKLFDIDEFNDAPVATNLHPTATRNELNDRKGSKNQNNVLKSNLANARRTFATEEDIFSDDFEDFQLDIKTPISNKTIKKTQQIVDDKHSRISDINFDDMPIVEISETDFFNDAGSVNQKPVAELRLDEVIDYEEPIQFLFTIKGWFKTLSSKLRYDNGYHLLAIITDPTKHYVQVLLADEVLDKLVGYKAQKVKEAATGRLSDQEKQCVKKAIYNAEKSLQINKWRMNVIYDHSNEIYKVVSMVSTGVVEPT